MAYQDVILATAGLSAYWPLNGDATDAAVGNNGTAANVSFTGSGIPADPNGVTAVFNGTSSRIDITDSADLDLGNLFTVELWVLRANLLTSSQVVLCKFSPAYQVDLSSGHLNGTQPGVGGMAQVLNVGYTTTDWMHIALVKRGTAQADTDLYINGVNATTSRTARTLSDNTSLLRLGADGTTGTPNFYFAGQIAHVALYKGTALDGPTIAAHHTAGMTPPASAPGRISLGLRIGL